MKKKTISLILALILLLSCSATAQATIVLHPEQKMIHQLCIFIIVTESAITSEQEPLVDPHKTDR